LHKTSKLKITKVDKVYELYMPQAPTPLIFDSPHSGDIYPDNFNYACDFKDLQRAEDKFVDELFLSAPDFNAPLLCATFPRTYIDVNRASDDIEADIMSDPWPENEPPLAPTNRSIAGIGLIRKLIKPETPVYNRKLSPKEIMMRRDTYYWPYHHALARLINDAHAQFGVSHHINCHSMPSAASQNRFRCGIASAEPDFVLGDRNGTSCDLEFTHFLRDKISSLGYKVAINNPYKGVELVERYSAPSLGKHSIQIEISRALYMDEQKCIKSNNFNKLKDDTDILIREISSYVYDKLKG